MREILISNHEKSFILQAISNKQRLDGRGAFDYREMQITFGIDRGCVEVTLGHTRVLAQVSCEVVAPKDNRPNEGNIAINVELSPMAAPNFEQGRQFDLVVEVNRLLEKSIKDSRCIDTESLCIMAGSQVWNIRVDVHVLNHDGNLIDSTSVAAIAALAHFRRPDVTIEGEEVTIHTKEEKDPVPLSVHHMPICVSFAFYHDGKFLLVDPTLAEEKVKDGRIVIAMNKHREICTFQKTGSTLLLMEQVMRCSNMAVVKVVEITELIHTALENDAKARSEGKKFGSASLQNIRKLTSTQMKLSGIEQIEDDSVKLADDSVHLSDHEAVEDDSQDNENDSADNQESQIMDSDISTDNSDKPTSQLKDVSGYKRKVNSTTATIGEGGASTWDLPDAAADSDGTKQDAAHTVEKHVPQQQQQDDSDEEEVMVMESDALKMRDKPSKQNSTKTQKIGKNTTKKKTYKK